MANVNAPTGLRPVRFLTGAPWNGAVNEYSIASGYATSLFIGDPVKLVAGGTIERAAAGETILGVFAGCSYSQSANTGTHPLQQNYWPASTVASDAVALVVDDPSVIFEIQGDEALAATDVGANADVVAGNGSTVTKQSGFQLDSSTATNGSAQLRILRKVPRDDNAWAAYVKVEVLINEHFYKSTSGI